LDRRWLPTRAGPEPGTDLRNKARSQQIHIPQLWLALPPPAGLADHANAELDDMHWAGLS